MAAIQRRGLHLQQRNEENLTGKNGTSRTNTSRTALSNISNIQRRPNLGSKKKEFNADKPVAHKAITRVKSQTDLQQRQLPHQFKEVKKEAFPIHHEEEELENELELTNNDLFDVEDIDEDDEGNPTLCAEYVKDIYRYLHANEKRLKTGDYLHKQSEINKKMRSILIDWLIQVASRFNLLQETLYLTVHLIDRFLEKHNVNRTELQLVGVTAMLLASKYEEMFAPEIGDFVYISDNAYSKTMIRSMEQKLLRAIDYDLSHPLCLHFLRRNSKAGSMDAQKHTLAKYLMEAMLIDYGFSQRLPSEIAAAALYLSIKLIDNSEWSSTLEHYSGYTEEAILPVVAAMSSVILSTDASKYQAVKTKYSTSKFFRISRLPELKGTLIQEYAESHVNK